MMSVTSAFCLQLATNTVPWNPLFRPKPELERRWSLAIKSKQLLQVSSSISRGEKMTVPYRWTTYVNTCKPSVCLGVRTYVCTCMCIKLGSQYDTKLALYCFASFSFYTSLLNEHKIEFLFVWHVVLCHLYIYTRAVFAYLSEVSEFNMVESHSGSLPSTH